MGCINKAVFSDFDTKPSSVIFLSHFSVSTLPVWLSFASAVYPINMLRAQLCLPTVSGAGLVAQQFDGSRLVSNSLVSFSSRFSFQLGFRGRHSRGSKSVIISCRASRGSSGDRSANGEDRDQDYLEAFVLISGFHSFFFFFLFFLITERMNLFPNSLGFSPFFFLWRGINWSY